MMGSRRRIRRGCSMSFTGMIACYPTICCSRYGLRHSGHAQWARRGDPALSQPTFFTRDDWRRGNANPPPI